MNDELNLYLRTVPKSLGYALSTLEKHISAHGEIEDTLTETTYEEFVQATEDIITAASHMAKTLKIIAEEIDLPEPGPIAGAALKPPPRFRSCRKGRNRLQGVS